LQVDKLIRLENNMTAVALDWTRITAVTIVVAVAHWETDFLHVGITRGGAEQLAAVAGAYIGRDVQRASGTDVRAAVLKKATEEQKSTQKSKIHAPTVLGGPSTVVQI
jgi:hypothetical protein